MVDRAFLKPRSVDAPPQGDHTFIPKVVVLEADSAAGLSALLSADFATNAASSTAYWVIESVKYQVVVTQPAVGMQPAELRYSALVHATQVAKV